MKEQGYTPRYLRKRKMMMVLPLLVLPFITLAFFALGGGQGKSGDNLPVKKEGMNWLLPEASAKEEKNLDKLSFYDKAARDSAKLAEYMQADPYYTKGIRESGADNRLPGLQGLLENKSGKQLGELNSSPFNRNSNSLPVEDQLEQKIAALQKEINSAATQGDEPIDTKKGKPAHGDDSEGQFSSEVDRLEKMMTLMSEKKGDDPEMKELEGMLDKILDIQHPERVKGKLQAVKPKVAEKKLMVSTIPSDWNVSLLDTGGEKQSQSLVTFYSDDETTSEIELERNTIRAVVHGTQLLQPGAVVKMRLLQPVAIGGHLIPKDQFIYGVVSLGSDRLQVSIRTILSQGVLLPVKLRVYDLDGLEGLHVPNSLGGESIRQSSEQGVQGMELNMIDPTIKGQAIATGLQTAKSLLTKKVRQVKVLVKAGYTIVLREVENN